MKMQGQSSTPSRHYKLARRHLKRQSLQLLLHDHEFPIDLLNSNEKAKNGCKMYYFFLIFLDLSPDFVQLFLLKPVVLIGIGCLHHRTCEKESPKLFVLFH